MKKLILLTAGLIAGLLLALHWIDTDACLFGWVVGSVVFLFLCEWATILIIDKKSQTASDRQSVNLLMGLKAGKLLLSVFFVLIYAVAVKIELKKFVIVFVLLYLIYLTFDTLYLIGREKETKKNKLLTKE